MKSDNQMDDFYLEIVVSRAHVEGLKIGWLVDELMKLSENKSETLEWQGKAFLRFDGWEEDGRELFEIPEIVRFYAEVSKQWNYWLHFFVPDAESMGLIYFMCFDLEFKRIDGHIAHRIKDGEALMRQMGELESAAKVLHASHGFSQEYSASVLERAENVFGGLFCS